MPALVDHLVYAAPELGAAVEELRDRFGVAALPGGQHVGLGTRNALFGLDAGRYLEVIAPDPGQPAPPMGRPFGIDELTDARLAGWAIGCEDIDDAIKRTRSNGYDPGDAVEMQRNTSEGAVVRWRLTLNALNGGPVPFLIDWGGSEHPSGSTPPGLTLLSLRLEHPDPGTVAAALDALEVDVEVALADRFALVARIRGPGGVTELS
jgi:Glyoxalase-like domain